MKPTSLTSATAAPNRALNSGHQASQFDGWPGTAVNAATDEPIIIGVAKRITNQGMTCTNSSVFNVAWFALREVMPIHRPNQHSASRFAPVLNADANAALTVTPTSVGTGTRFNEAGADAALVPLLAGVELLVVMTTE